MLAIALLTAGLAPVAGQQRSFHWITRGTYSDSACSTMDSTWGALEYFPENTCDMGDGPVRKYSCGQGGVTYQKFAASDTQCSGQPTQSNLNPLCGSSPGVTGFSKWTCKVVANIVEFHLHSTTNCSDAAPKKMKPLDVCIGSAGSSTKYHMNGADMQMIMYGSKDCTGTATPLVLAQRGTSCYASPAGYYGAMAAMSPTPSPISPGPSTTAAPRDSIVSGAWRAPPALGRCLAAAPALLAAAAAAATAA
mmetsp:Transcript_119178/g.371263  ORF Transcript_119178/g.371263 Transcript_119178/m.371263 type:complete len:250 (+) Transcript_119178:65-814(+)